MSCTGKIHAGGTGEVQFIGANIDGTYANSLSITFQVYAFNPLTQAVGSAIDNGSGSMSYVAASDGDYTGTISKTASLDRGTLYHIVLTDSTYGVIAEGELPTY